MLIQWSSYSWNACDQHPLVTTYILIALAWWFDQCPQFYQCRLQLFPRFHWTHGLVNGRRISQLEKSDKYCTSHKFSQCKIPAFLLDYQWTCLSSDHLLFFTVPRGGLTLQGTTIVCWIHVTLPSLIYYTAYQPITSVNDVRDKVLKSSIAYCTCELVLDHSYRLHLC